MFRNGKQPKIFTSAEDDNGIDGIGVGLHGHNTSGAERSASSGGNGDGGGSSNGKHGTSNNGS